MKTKTKQMTHEITAKRWRQAYERNEWLGVNGGAAQQSADASKFNRNVTQYVVFEKF